MVVRIVKNMIQGTMMSWYFSMGQDRPVFDPLCEDNRHDNDDQHPFQETYHATTHEKRMAGIYSVGHFKGNSEMFSFFPGFLSGNRFHELLSEGLPRREKVPARRDHPDRSPFANVRAFSKSFSSG
jgi:hypothetical protein